ncbi:MAG TPA: energy transducer TonB [Thermoanaerobaculia bacterium]|nr:energy transducer TonB [Thermoanaerobaculia bacterium]
MSATVQEVLDARGRAVGRRPVAKAFWLVLTGHVALTVALLLLPNLLTEPPAPMRFVAVQLVPARALGVETPRPAPRPEPRATPAPRPVEAQPTPAPAAPEAPRLPSPLATPEPRPASPPASPAAAGPAVAGAASGPAETAGSPSGVAGGVAFGAAVAGVDNPSFTYGYYLDQMLALIQRQWVRPALGSGIEALVTFRIQRDGRLTELQVATSSGYNSFDLAALRSVQAASPLPPLPQGYPHSSLGVNLIFR